MRSRLKNIVSIGLLLVLLASLVVACKSEEATAIPEPAEEQEPEPAEEQEPEPEEPQIEAGELEVGVLWEEGSTSYDLVKEIGDSMEQDFPGTKVIYTFNNTAARPAIEARMQAGDPLDVDFIFEGMDPNTYDWVEGGYVMDITDAMNEERSDGTTWKDDFNPLFLPSMEYEGEVYGASEQVFIWLLHYNKKMFDDWGLTPPTTWDEFLETCETIKGKGVAPVAVTGQVNYYVGMWWDSLIQRIVGTDKVMEYLYADTDMKLSDDPGFLQAAEEMIKLKDNGYLIEGWEATDFTTVQVFFFQDRAAMMLMGSWLMTEMRESIPEGFQLAVAPFPTYEGGQGRQDAMFGRALSWSVPAQTDVPDLAVEFLKRYTSKEASAKRAEVLGAVSPMLDVPAPAGIGGIEEVLESAKTAEFILYNYGIGSAQFGLLEAWYDPLVEMWLGDLTPEEALDKIDANVAAVREQRAAAGE